MDNGSLAVEEVSEDKAMEVPRCQSSESPRFQSELLGECPLLNCDSIWCLVEI